MFRARPLVTLHFAQSLDGRIGFGPARKPALLSGDEGVVCAHRARAESDAVVVGIRTLLHDDPRLTARCEGASSHPARVVLDSELRMPLGSRLLAPDSQAGPVLVFASAARASAERKRELERAGVTVLLTGADRAGRVALPEVLDLLAARGAKRVLVEGGAQVITSFLQARLAERAEIELTPWLLGSGALPAVHELGVQELGRALRLDAVRVEQLGQSLLVRGDIVYPAQDAP